jgi:hypothetical protein
MLDWMPTLVIIAALSIAAVLAVRKSAERWWEYAIVLAVAAALAKHWRGSLAMGLVSAVHFVVWARR